MESISRRIGCEPRLPLACVVAFRLHLAAVCVSVLGAGNTKLLSFAAIVWVTTAAALFVIEDGLLIKWWFYPQWAVWYRLSGVGARPDIVRGTLARAPLRTATAVTPYFAIFVLWSVPSFYVQYLISMLLFACRPVLSAAAVESFIGWSAWFKPKLYVLHDCPWRVSDLFLP
ncbi:hypothetical protein F4823DRAFT_354539 [Ustulina deusta]|nr:hypothetical protein F4823DRAFT_354539 [Ustulina deusta]